MADTKMVKFKVMAPLMGHKTGDVIELMCDSEGKPLNNFWFRRLKDSEMDRCLQAVDEKQHSKKEKVNDNDK